MPEIVFLCLGSNLGDREAWLEKARRGIESHIGRVTKCSSVYETKPWGFTADKNFLNQVLKVETLCSPEEVLTRITNLEKQCHRVRQSGGKYISRTLDIDILYYDKLVCSSEMLTLPHPRMEYRKFVLQPLAETDPDFIHPVLLKTSRQLLEECIDTCEVVLYHPD